MQYNAIQSNVIPYSEREATRTAAPKFLFPRSFCFRFTWLRGGQYEVHFWCPEP